MGDLRIFHPSDLTKTSEAAFAHALRFAMGGAASLTVLHVAPWGREPRWDDFPASAELVERWGMPPLDPGRVRWVDLPGADPVRAILSYLDEHTYDLVVVASHGRSGFDAWFSGSVAEPISRLSKAMTLFVRQGCRPLVAADTGEVSLKRVLVPVVTNPHFQPALDVAPHVASWLGLPPPTVSTCFVGDEALAPNMVDHDLTVCEGDPAAAIVALAEQQAADLIVMVTAGRRGILDALRGSTTDQVVRCAPCPVLAVNATA